jgi:hypothetical protein
MGKTHTKTIEQLNKALFDAFNSFGLRKLVRYGLNEPLDNIAGENKSREEIIFEITDWAEKKGLLPKLIKNALKLNPTNENLQKFSKQFAENSIDELLSKKDYNSVHPILKKLRVFLGAGQYPPNIIIAFVDLVQHMQKEISSGTDLNEIIVQILDGDFIQNNWECYEIYNDEREVFDSVLRIFLKNTSAEQILNILIPIILVIMNSKEANELAQGNLFKGFPAQIQKDFNELRIILEKNGASDWVSRYKRKAEDWKPFSNSRGAKNIKTLIENEFSALTYEGQKFLPEIIDIRKLIGKSNRERLRLARQEKCIVIMDIISMCHPLLHSYFHEAGLDVYDNTYVVSLAPISSAFDKFHQMSLIIQMKITNMEFAKRRHDKDDEDWGVCEELHESELFGTWLTKRIKKMTGSDRKSKDDIHELNFQMPEVTK